MSDCCNNQSSKKKYACPADGQAYAEVSVRTMLHHLAEPWAVGLTADQYFFCSNPDCKVVYFGSDDSVIEQAQLRTAIGSKIAGDNGLVCYCFGVTKRQAKEDDTLKAYVAEQTKNKLCSCETTNPSGRCCLKDFN